MYHVEVIIECGKVFVALLEYYLATSQELNASINVTKSVLSRWDIFVAIAKTHCMGQNDRFSFNAKNHYDIK